MNVTSADVFGISTCGVDHTSIGVLAMVVDDNTACPSRLSELTYIFPVCSGFVGGMSG